ncbi:protein IQ-DOMAIN 31 [Prunus yedoensis var. nudiflora]|uniref:Protein IQ-DOMAIN 31 n=1 Tax=Prunus yedoensis var. nudiflora TaxID=2094558 RepID=A0A314YNV3_PRUYE|nr:protein IQ-DOMAIN 31 [Prunus yedoensis var. nudiflora]
MGKTPGKWIKNLLLGKKSSKYSLSKGREKSTNKGKEIVSSKLSVSELTVSAPLISPPLVSPPVVGTEDHEIIKQEQAATKAQSAYRGYVARRAYRTLKGIIRLQALIRGHLVRRQAVSTLFCVQGIVKLQALIRGQLARHSDIGVEVNKTHLGDLSEVSASSHVERLSKIAFIQKLLASLPTTVLYVSNMVQRNLIRPGCGLSAGPGHAFGNLQAKKKCRRLSNTNVENGSNRVTPDSEKTKRNLRKFSRHPASSVPEHQQNEVEKVKSNVRKSSDPKKGVSDPSVVGDERSKHSTLKSLASAAPDDSEQGTSEFSEKMKHMAVAVSKHSDLEGSVDLPSAEEPMEKLDDHPSVDVLPMENNVRNEDHPSAEMQPMENNVRNEDHPLLRCNPQRTINEEVQAINEVPISRDHIISNEDKKTSQRRASFPVKFDHQENGVHNTPRVPSYMAPTASAKARLRGQGSPRFDRDMVEKNVITRRHSLSASTNTKLSSLSPRAQGLVQAAGKGVIRSDRSLSSSRDGLDKVIQPEWRR